MLQQLSSAQNFKSQQKIKYFQGRCLYGCFIELSRSLNLLFFSHHKLLRNHGNLNINALKNVVKAVAIINKLLNTCLYGTAKTIEKNDIQEKHNTNSRKCITVWNETWCKTQKSTYLSSSNVNLCAMWQNDSCNLPLFVVMFSAMSLMVFSSSLELEMAGMPPCLRWLLCCCCFNAYKKKTKEGEAKTE